jgi:hypothetical protein
VAQVTRTVGGRSTRIEIGLPEVYNQVTNLGTQMAQIDGKLSLALQIQTLRLDTQGSELVDHESRLRMLEQRPYVSPNSVRWAVATLLTAIGVAVAIVSLIVG